MLTSIKININHLKLATLTTYTSGMPSDFLYKTVSDLSCFLKKYCYISWLSLLTMAAGQLINMPTCRIVNLPKVKSSCQICWQMPVIPFQWC